MLMYMLFTKLFPVVSIWETRQSEAQVEPTMAQTPQPAPQRLGSIPTTTIIILIACLLFGAGHARAAEKKGPAKKPPETTTLSLEWEQLATSEPKAQPGGETGWVAFWDHLFGWRPAESEDRTENPPPKFVITATLLDAKGQPLDNQIVGLSLKTAFGKLGYGKHPTNAEGKAQFTMQDRRYGKYSVEATYDGGDQFAAAHAVTNVDFAPLPEVSLPPEGVLITPYPTAAIALPFLIFYGTMWVVFFYVGYLMIWRLRKIHKHQALGGKGHW